MRITSDPFELSPGFDAEGRHYSHCTVRLLTNAERRQADISIRSKTNAELAAIKNEKKAGDKDGQAGPDPILVYTIGQKIEKQHLCLEEIHSFVAEDGTIIEDRKSIEKCFGLLTEPDEQEIAYQQEELKRKYTRPHFRPPHTCPECGYEKVECA